MNHQKHLFQLPEDIHYLNCAYMSPLLRSVEDAGIKGLIKKRNPVDIAPKDFFETAESVKKKAATLINAHTNNIAIIPSASYGLSNAINNVPITTKTEVIIIKDEFPSAYNTIKKWCQKYYKTLRVIEYTPHTMKKGNEWNTRILENINVQTALVVMSSVHWADGTKFSLEDIGAKCKSCDAFFIVDGTQSVGISPIDVRKANIDALICPAYKWLFGPYSIGFAFYSHAFNQGTPIEESWLNRTNAAYFSKLTQYTDEYKSGAARYSVGEYSNFILLPMLDEALKQIIEWGVENMEAYCNTLFQPLLTFLEKSNFSIEEPAFRSKHLIGISLPPNVDMQNLMKQLETHKVYTSIRGNSLRISGNVYNTEEDIFALVKVLKELESL
ncbi:MAG: aminotransferase class V-fold PLP-dependent enzyme [Chitinophagaceae bacterium]|nr:aminotransferase class V-fold PLP-dependent enzyme [Chitinophagaceae bacterium]